MICVSVTPTSRTLAPADLLNASRKADLVELCLDYFVKTPDVNDLVKNCEKPVLISCRTPREGGHFSGTEEERLNLLRQAIISGPAYVDLDLSIADKIPRFGDTKRVISYTNLNRPTGNIDEIFERCWKARADVVKVTWPIEDLDAAWPLLAATSKRRELPVVGQGIGASGITFSLLGRKYGSPWIYAALERGMEAYAGQPSVFQLEEEYCWGDINKKTRFVGVIGQGAAENASVRVLNAAFREIGKPIRCLPLLPGKTDLLEKRLESMKINALVVDPLWQGQLLSMATPADDFVQQTEFCDVLTQGKNGWKARQTFFDAINETAVQEFGQRWNAGRATTVFGISNFAKAFAVRFQSESAAVSLAAPSNNDSARVARQVEARHLPWSSIHSVATDVVTIADSSIRCGQKSDELNPALIREGAMVLDFSAYPGESLFAPEAKARGARYLAPSAVFATQLMKQFKLLTQRDMPPQAFAEALK